MENAEIFIDNTREIKDQPASAIENQREAWDRVKAKIGGPIHDVNNMLAVMSGHGELLEMSLKGAALEEAQIIINQSQATGKFTKEILGLSRQNTDAKIEENIQALQSAMIQMPEIVLRIKAVRDSAIAIMGSGQNDKIINRCETIKQAAERALAILDHAIKEYKGEKLPPRKVNLESEIAKWKSLLNKIAEARMPGAVVNFSSKTAEAKIVTDPTLLFETVQNLTVNAADAEREAGQVEPIVEISLDRRQPPELSPERAGESFVAISVVDNGTGMDEETQRKMYDRAFSSKGSLGTGLGLGQVSDYVKGNRGFITVSSQLGRGSTFTIFLPEEQHKSASAA